MYRKYEPEQNEDVQMQDQQPDMYDHMDYEDVQYMQGGRPMYCYPMPYQGEMYQNQPMPDWYDQDMSRQLAPYGRPRRRRRRRRRRPYYFYFYMPPFYYHNRYPRYDWDDDDDDDDDDYDYDRDDWD